MERPFRGQIGCCDRSTGAAGEREGKRKNENFIDKSQIYSCNGIYDPEAPIARKEAHGGPDLYYPQHSCLVIEQESWIDAINNPEWKIDQIYGPGKPYIWESTYTFSLVE